MPCFSLVQSLSAAYGVGLPDSTALGVCSGLVLLCRDHWNLGRRLLGGCPRSGHNALPSQPADVPRTLFGLVIRQQLAACALFLRCGLRKPCGSPTPFNHLYSWANNPMFLPLPESGGGSFRPSGSKELCCARTRLWSLFCCGPPCYDRLAAPYLILASPVHQRRVYSHLPFIPIPQVSPEALSCFPRSLGERLACRTSHHPA